MANSKCLCANPKWKLTSEYVFDEQLPSRIEIINGIFDEKKRDNPSFRREYKQHIADALNNQNYSKRGTITTLQCEICGGIEKITTVFK